MSRASLSPIELIEYVPRQFSPAELPAEIGETLWRHYSPQVAVEFPSPKTANQWQLTAQGWAGYIPLTAEWKLALLPGIEVGNLFRMLEYAYRLESFRFLEGEARSTSLAEFYDRLALALARRVLARSRKGLYRAYVPQAGRLPYLRGRLDLTRTLARPDQTSLACRYAESTADVEDNRILAWTLERIARSGLSTDRSLPAVRQAYHTLRQGVSLVPYGPEACRDRPYSRLNEDYRPLHALCRFFLAHTGPGHLPGDWSTLPFLVNMARLYELFVAEWLAAHLPPSLSLEAQARVALGEPDLHFQIDLVLAEAGTPRRVLDTKYKAQPGPATEDIAQVVAYAQAKGCGEAVLVYPAPLARPLDTRVGDIRVRSLTFDLKGDLEQAGQQFLKDLCDR